MLTVREYRPEDRSGCLNLIRAGHDPTFSDERFDWLHSNSPRGRSLSAVCTDGQRIAGMYSVIPKTVKLGEKIYVGGRDIDPVVHPDWRGRGVFTRLLDFALAEFRGVDFVFNFANPASAPGFLSRDWRSIGPLEDRVFQTGYTSILSRDFLLWLGTGAKQNTSSDPTVRELALDEVSDLLSGASGPPAVTKQADRIWVERDPAYLKWRYLDSPLHRYRWFVQGDVGNKLAFAICRHDSGTQRLIIVDTVGYGLQPSLCTWFPLWKSVFPRTWICVWSSVPPQVRAGFISNPLRRGHGRTFLVRPWPGRQVPEGLLALDSWSVSHGDLEIT